MKKIMITGKDGQVGWELQRLLSPLGQIFTYDRNGLDLRNSDQIRNVIREVRPDVIVNAAAYTAVDKAEIDQESAMAINATAVGVIAEEAKKLDGLFIHYSTDYVFDGSAASPYREMDKTNPMNIYGKSKLKGEEAIQTIGGKHLILRTSWVYGMRGNNFLMTMLRLGKERDQLKIVGDQIGAPTWSHHIAEKTGSMISNCLNRKYENDPWGIYHLTSSGYTSWFEFAETIFDFYRKSSEQRFGELKISNLLKIPSIEYPTPAMRPKYSVLSNEKILKNFQISMPNWKDALVQCMKNM